MKETTAISPISTTELQTRTEYFRALVKCRSDSLMNYFLIGFFLVGLLLAGYNDTWGIDIGVGGLSLVAYYSVKYFLPGSDLYPHGLSRSPDL